MEEAQIKKKKWKASVKHPLSTSKQPRSAYNYFFSEEIKKPEYEGIKRQEVVKAIGQRWRTLKDKSNYESLAAEDKKRFKAQGSTTLRIKRTDLKYKRPLNPYMIFYNQQFQLRYQSNKLETLEISKAISEGWKKLKPEQKKVYKDQYQRDLKDYHRKRKMHLEFQKELVITKSQQKQIAPKRKMSAYAFFTRDRFQSMGEDLKPRDKFKMIREQWKRITVKELRKYQDLARADAKRFENELIRLRNK